VTTRVRRTARPEIVAPALGRTRRTLYSWAFRTFTVHSHDSRFEADDFAAESARHVNYSLDSPFVRGNLELADSLASAS
jgi:hypothetical protein